MSGTENQNVIFVSEVEKGNICFGKIFIFLNRAIRRYGDQTIAERLG